MNKSTGKFEEGVTPEIAIELHHVPWADEIDAQWKIRTVHFTIGPMHPGGAFIMTGEQWAKLGAPEVITITITAKTNE